MHLQKVNSRIFVLLILLAIICGLVIGAGLAMVLGEVRVCTSRPLSLDNLMKSGLDCQPLDQATKNNVAVTLIAFGAMAGIIPHTEPFKIVQDYLVNRFMKKIEKKGRHG
ncbi:MAG: hypothetical protein MUP03_08770 [Anaerolineales bacterium]|nr:hypothetical protein [Anaerolineales bacterium]